MAHKTFTKYNVLENVINKQCLYLGPPQVTKKCVMFSFIIMPPGTIVPMGAYCFYCVRTYVRMSEFG